MEKEVVLIAGAPASMGKATALLLREGGYQVYAAARRLDKMSNLRELGIKLLTMDFTSEVSAAEGIAL